MAGGSRLDQPGRASTEVTGVKGEGYGSNRSREGPRTSSPRRRPAERGRRRTGASRLARSKGPAGQRHDDARRQVANSIPPRPRPHGLNSAEPGCGIRLPIWTVSTDNKAAVARPVASVQPERKTPPRAGLKYWDERTQRVVELVPPAQYPTTWEVPPLHKKIRRPPSWSRRHEMSRQGSSLKTFSFPSDPPTAQRTPLIPAKAGIQGQAGPRDASGAGDPAETSGKVRHSPDTGDVATVALFCYFVRLATS